MIFISGIKNGGVVVVIKGFAMMTDKHYTSESIRLQANESMLNSKGFLLFVVLQDGSLETIGDTTDLSTVERLGLDQYRQQDIIK